MSKTLEQIEKQVDKVAERLTKDGFTTAEVTVVGQILASKGEMIMHLQLHHMKPLIQVMPKMPPGPKGGA